MERKSTVISSFLISLKFYDLRQRDENLIREQCNILSMSQLNSFRLTSRETLKLTTHLIFICRDVYLISASFITTHAAEALSVVWMTRYQNFTVVARYKAPGWKCSEVSWKFFLHHIFFFLLAWWWFRWIWYSCCEIWDWLSWVECSMLVERLRK